MVFNVGTLVQPTTKANRNRATLPRSLILAFGPDVAVADGKSDGSGWVVSRLGQSSFCVARMTRGAGGFGFRRAGWTNMRGRWTRCSVWVAGIIRHTPANCRDGGSLHNWPFEQCCESALSLRISLHYALERIRRVQPFEIIVPSPGMGRSLHVSESGDGDFAASGRHEPFYVVHVACENNGFVAPSHRHDNGVNDIRHSGDS